MLYDVVYGLKTIRETIFMLVILKIHEYLNELQINTKANTNT